MKKRRIAIALGHDALGVTLPEQKEAAVKAAKAIADLIEDDCKVVITHSNAPQVGMIHMAMSELHKNFPEYTTTPMSVCSAMSQGYIGYDLQNSIRGELLSRGIHRTVATILTQVIVDPYDEAFYKPSKLIGQIMTEEEAALEEKKGNFVAEVEGGYRRIVAAPEPIEIVEIDAVNALMDAGQIVIAAGGGGIPVLSQGSNLKGASAVIEKDHIAGLLADKVCADTLIILSDVESVFTSYGKEKQEPIYMMTCDQARAYIDNKEFGEFDMLPKIETALKFIGESDARQVLITKIDSIDEALAGKTGTIIRR